MFTFTKYRYCTSTLIVFLGKYLRGYQYPRSPVSSTCTVITVMVEDCAMYCSSEFPPLEKGRKTLQKKSR